MNQKKIVFLGSDGSGKSTLIKYMKDKLEKEGKSVSTFEFGWKEFKSPLMRFISKRHLEKKKIVNKEERKLSRFRSRGWIFYILYYYELLYRYSDVLKSHSEYLLFDRYFYDEFTFASPFKQKILKIFTPKPDLCVILKAPLKTIRKRGIRVEKEQLDNFYSHLSKAKKFAHTIVLNSIKPRKEMYMLVMALIEKRV